MVFSSLIFLQYFQPIMPSELASHRGGAEPSALLHVSTHRYQDLIRGGAHLVESGWRPPRKTSYAVQGGLNPLCQVSYRSKRRAKVVHFFQLKNRRVGKKSRQHGNGVVVYADTRAQNQ